MAESPWIIRRATCEDSAFRADMLVEAVNWSPEWKQKSRRVLSAPGTAHFVVGWPRDTELGVIAEADGSRLARPGFDYCLKPIRDTDSSPRTYRN